MEKYAHHLMLCQFSLTLCVNGIHLKARSIVRRIFLYKHNDKEIIKHQLKRQNVTESTAACVLEQEKGSS